MLGGEGFAEPNPRPMFPNPPGLLRLEPHSEGLRERIWWGAASQATAVWAAGLGLNLQSSTLINNESDKPFHLQQAEQIQAYRDAWRRPATSGSRGSRSAGASSPLVDDRDRAYFGRRNQDTDQIGFIDANTQAIFGRTYAAEPDVLIQQLKEDEAIAAADTLLLTVPNQLGVDYNAHVIDGDPHPRGARARLAVSQQATSEISLARRGLAPSHSSWPYRAACMRVHAPLTFSQRLSGEHLVLE